MKILYVSGYSRMILFNKIIPEALRAAGFEVHEFDWNSVYRFNKAIKIFSSDTVRKKINSEVLLEAKKVKPHFIFVLKGEPIFTETLQKLKKETGAVLFNWFGDDPWEYPVFSGKVAPFYDYFFTYDPYSVNLYRRDGHKGAFHLPYGYDPALISGKDIRKSDRRKYECDVAFIASHYPKREEIMRELKKKFKVKIWGRGWKKSSCRDVYQGSALYGLDMLKAMKCAKIVLNIHKGFEEGVAESGEGCNLRVMEAAACKALQFSNFQKDIPNRFEPDKEIILFENRKELFEKIEHYLWNFETGRTIGDNAYLRLTKNHTLEIRMKEMFNLMGIKT